MVNEKGVESMLEKEKVGFIKIEGKVSSEARKTLVDRFQHNLTSKFFSHHVHVCEAFINSYPARARARRAHALRALGLLLADGALTVGWGKTFWGIGRVPSRKRA